MVSNSVIRDLNDILKKQLTLINQFFIHSKVQKIQGYTNFATNYARLGVIGGKVAERLIEQLVSCEELPQIKDYDLLKSYRDVNQQLISDTSLILALISNIHICLKKCKEHGEEQIERLLLEILKDAEKQADFLESQLSIIDAVGLDVFLSGLRSEKQELSNYQNSF